MHKQHSLLHPMDIKENPDTAQIESSAQGEQAPEAADSAKSRKAWVALVIFAVIITVVAWVAMVYNEYVSFYSAVAGLVGHSWAFLPRRGIGKQNLCSLRPGLWSRIYSCHCNSPHARGRKRRQQQNHNCLERTLLLLSPQ